MIDSYSPIYAFFNFDKYTQLYFKRTFCKYDDGNYDLLKQYVRDFDCRSLKMIILTLTLKM